MRRRLLLKRKNKVESRIIRANLRKTLEKEGCPICTILYQAEVKRLKHLIYELVNDPATRHKLRSSLGLCNYHSWLLVKLIEENKIPDKLGPTIIMKDLLEELLEKNYLMENEVKGKCFICIEKHQLEEIYLEETIRWINNSCDNFLDEYSESPSILCLKHYMQIREKMVKKKCREKLLALQEEKIRKTLKLLDSYINKSRYDSKEKPNKMEGEAYKKAITILKGHSTLVKEP